MENFDIDLLSFTHMIRLYKEKYGMLDVKKLCYLLPGVLIENAELVMLENDEGIKKLSELCRNLNKDEVLCVYPAPEENENAPQIDIGNSQIGDKNVPDGCIGSSQIGDATEDINDDALLGEIMDNIIHEYLNLGDTQPANEEETEHIDAELVGEFEDYSSNSECGSDIDLKILEQSRRRVKYDIDDNNPHFLLGMTFKDAEDARLAIRRYSVQKCTPLRIRPNDSRRLRAKCKAEGCPFHLYISKESITGCMMVRRIDDGHNCLKDGNNNLASYKFLATEFKTKLYENPKMSVKQMIQEAQNYMKLYVSKSKGKRAKRFVLNELDGSFKAEFAGIATYVDSITEKDPNTSAELELCEESAKARRKPIVTMLDAIRLKAMNRLATNKVLVEAWPSEWSHTCLQLYQQALDKAFDCNIVFNGAHGYEIEDREGRQKVFLDKLICSCRSWELTGIPCAHAICAFKHAKRDPMQFISLWYHKRAYMAAYEVPILPMEGKLIQSSDKSTQVEPPHAIKLTGRPRSKRIKGANETRKGNTRGKMSKKGLAIKCSICKIGGHNKVKCPSKNSQNLSGLGSQTTNAKSLRKNKRTSGLGIFIDENTGTTILNPGFSSERLVSQNYPLASQTLSSNPDVNVRFSIPRPIAFAGEGTSSIATENLPFKPPGLKWKGKRVISTKQLQNERDKKKAKKGDKN
ncbi:hypothetical protein C2S51_013155 [Perilla frutescens var. frutescens]|nr:hypothetical protein C2S51_013155 [Perilla frutescens var. frutescens]